MYGWMDGYTYICTVHMCHNISVFHSPAPAPVTCRLSTGQRGKGHMHIALCQLESVAAVKRSRFLFIKVGEPQVIWHTSNVQHIGAGHCTSVGECSCST